MAYQTADKKSINLGAVMKNINSNTEDIVISIAEFRALNKVFNNERQIFIDSYLINTCLSAKREFTKLSYLQLLYLTLNGLLNYDQENLVFKWYKFIELPEIDMIQASIKKFFVDTYYLKTFIPDVDKYRNSNKLSGVDIRTIVPQYNNLEPTNPIGGTERTSRYPSNYSSVYKEAIDKLFYK